MSMTESGIIYVLKSAIMFDLPYVHPAAETVQMIVHTEVVLSQVVLLQYWSNPSKQVEQQASPSAGSQFVSVKDK